MTEQGNPPTPPLPKSKNFRVGGEKLGTVGLPEIHIFSSAEPKAQDELL